MYYELTPKSAFLDAVSPQNERFVVDFKEDGQNFEAVPVGSPFRVHSSVNDLEKTLSSAFPEYQKDGIKANAFYNLSQDFVLGVVEGMPYSSEVRSQIRNMYEYMIVQFYYIPEEKMFSWKDIQAAAGKKDIQPLKSLSEKKKEK